MAHYAVGDIQGCYDSFLKLLALIDFRPQIDTLWIAGDLVNRGPKSLDVLRYIKNLPNKVAVLGNHDLALLALAYLQIPIKDHTLDKVLVAPDKEELLDWLRRLPLYHEDPSLPYVMVHAGIYPQWKMEEAKAYAQEVETQLRGDNFKELLRNMYGDEPKSWHPDLTSWPRYRFIINTFTRLRFCTLEGHLDLKYKGKLDSAPDHLKPWYEILEPPKQNKKILFGHWASLEGKTNVPYVEALDTGCVWGRHLTALRLEDAQRFSISCKDC